MQSRVSSLVFAGTLAAVAPLGIGCTFIDARPERLPRVVTDARPPWVDPLDAVVRIASDDGECSGVAIDDRLVVSSRACLQSIARFVPKNPGGLRARMGGGVVPWDAVPVVAILASPCHGVAALVTEKELPVPSLRMRLGAGVAVGEPVRLAGFGRCSQASFGARSVGFVARVREIGMSTFAIEGDSCVGDAGGPLVSEWTGEVVGVLEGDPAPTDLAGATMGRAGAADRVDVAAAMLAEAFLVAHGVRPAQLPPLVCE